MEYITNKNLPDNVYHFFQKLTIGINIKNKVKDMKTY